MSEAELVEAIMELNNEGDDWDAKHLGELIADWHNKQILEMLKNEQYDDERSVSAFKYMWRNKLKESKDE